MLLLTILSTFLACGEQPKEYIPGVIETDGALVATVNGVQIKDGIIDALLKDVPAEKQAEIDRAYRCERK